jgi:hypothetical protein
VSWSGKDERGKEGGSEGGEDEELGGPVDAVVSLRGLQSTPLSVFAVCRRRRCQSFGTPSTAFVVLEYVCT